jgi:hypothetical protein
MVKTIKDIFSEAASLNDYLSSRGINPKFVSRDTKISHAKSALFQKWKSDRKMSEETITEASESELLAKYLNSRGINAKYATKDIKIAHSKSGEFMKWKRDHQHLELGEETDNLVKENHVAIAMGNMLDDEGSMVLSQLEQLERAISMIRSHIGKDYEKQLPAWVQAKVTLATDYVDTVGNYITSKNEKVTEETVNEAKMPRTTALDRWRKAADEREKKHNDIEKARQEKLHQDPSKVTIPVANTQKDDLTLAIDRLEKHLNKEDAGISKTKETSFHKNLDTLVHKTFGKRKDEMKMKEEVEQIDEISKSTLSSYKDKSSASMKNAQANRDAAEPGKDMSKGFADLHAKSNKIVKNRVKGLIGYMQRKQGMKPTSENTLDSLAATEAPSDCSDNTNSTPTTGKSYASRMVKSLKKTVKEETYDWEKDDKSSMEKPYGKAPKMNVTDKTGTLGDTKPEARAVMKGGKTLTGQPRDMVEIDPSMKQRPGQDKGQSTFTSPIAKKSP